jgi:chemotaxis protein histidine kinase CheA
LIEIDPETLAIASEEALECLDRIEANLLALQGGGEDPGRIDALFRDAHSVKGTASMVGWRDVVPVAQKIEDQLAAARERGELPRQEIDPMLQATDQLRSAVGSASRAG